MDLQVIRLTRDEINLVLDLVRNGYDITPLSVDEVAIMGPIMQKLRGASIGRDEAVIKAEIHDALIVLSNIITRGLDKIVDTKSLEDEIERLEIELEYLEDGK